MAAKRQWGPEPPEPEVIHDLRELIPTPRGRTQLGHLIEQYYELGQEEKQIKEQRKPLNGQIKEILGEHGIGKCRHGELRVAFYTSTRKSLDRDRLMEALLNHVMPDVAKYIIQTSTVETSSTGLKVVREGEKEEE